MVDRATTDVEAVERLRRVARLLDSKFRFPGTRLRFGADALLGLVPGLGDAATAAISLYILAEAARLGVGLPTLMRMAWNVAVDFGLGAVPLLGDVFDLFWKSNLRNVELLEAALEKRRRRR